MNLRPLHDRVIVKRIESETTTASGIVIPDNAAENYVFCCHFGAPENLIQIGCWRLLLSLIHI